MMIAIRRHPAFASAWIIFCCERNMAHEASFLAREVREDRRVACIAQKPNEPDDYGWWTTTRKGPVRVPHARSPAEGSVAHARPDQRQPVQPDASTRAATMVERFEQQMRQYRIVRLESNNPLASARIGVSGKVGLDGRQTAGQKDDLAFCFTFAMSLWDSLLQREVPNFNYAEIGM